MSETDSRSNLVLSIRKYDQITVGDWIALRVVSLWPRPVPHIWVRLEMTSQTPPVKVCGKTYGPVGKKGEGRRIRLCLRDTIEIGSDVEIILLEARHGELRIGCRAPRDVRILTQRHRRTLEKRTAGNPV